MVLASADLRSDLSRTKNPRVLTLGASIDSGAAACVFPATLGEAIGLDITSGKKLPLSGATGVIEEQYLHDVMIVIGGHDIDVEVGFSYSFKFPFGLLGQKGFFEQFRVCFDLPKKDFEIVPKNR